MNTLNVSLIASEIRLVPSSCASAPCAVLRQGRAKRRNPQRRLRTCSSYSAARAVQIEKRLIFAERLDVADAADAIGCNARHRRHLLILCRTPARLLRLWAG